MCNYCQGTGHWKDQCPVLKSRGKLKSFSPAAALACSTVPVLKPICVGPGVGVKPFIASAVVTLVGACSNKSIA